MSQNFTKKHKTRSLPEVFKELQENNLRADITITTNPKKQLKKIGKSSKTNSKTFFPNWRPLFAKVISHKSNKKLVKKIGVFIAVSFISIILISTSSIFAADKPGEIKVAATKNDYESNRSSIDLHEVVNNNSKIIKKKEKSLVEQEIPYPITYKENPSLPKDEQVIIQKGVSGKQQLNLILTYENDELIEENTINTIIIQIPVEEVVEVGTSDFLNKHQVHLGDTIYVLNDTSLRHQPDITSDEVCKITRYAKVKILGISGQWCKVSYGNLEGYIDNNLLTSTYTTPGIDDKNRKQQILGKVSFAMELNTPSGLSLDDFKRILINNPQDKNKVFEQNVEAFYEAEQRYKVNGIFLISVAIHESNWATSNIAMDKKNLFGYGAYDSDAYNYAYDFGYYKEGIDLVAKVFAKNYLNPIGTKIYDEEIAQGKYYNGPTVAGVNMRYCTDVNWAQKVFSYMSTLYSKL